MLVNMWPIVDPNNLSVNSWLIVNAIVTLMMEHQHITNIRSTSWSVTSVQTQNVIPLVPLLGTEKNFLTENNGDPFHTKQVGKKID